MAKRKHKLTKTEKQAKKERHERYQCVFIGGKQKRVLRPPMIEELSVDEFIRRNADPIWLHQEGLWEYTVSEDEEEDCAEPALEGKSGLAVGGGATGHEQTGMGEKQGRFPESQ